MPAESNLRLANPVKLARFSKLLEYGRGTLAAELIRRNGVRLDELRSPSNGPRPGNWRRTLQSGDERRIVEAYVAGKGKVLQSDLAEQFGVSHQRVSQIICAAREEGAERGGTP